MQTPSPFGIDASTGHLAPRESEPQFVVANAPTIRAQAPTRVLLAEDDDQLRRLISKTLTLDGYHVVEVDNGIDLMRLVMDVMESHHPGPELVISDICMPGWTGMQVLEDVGRRLAAPIVLITAYGDPVTREQAMRLGAAAILDKPFSLGDLRTLVGAIRPVS